MGNRREWSPGPEGGRGRRSAAVVDAEALGNVLAAQRAGAQGLGAQLAAADMAAVEEDHLGLGVGGRVGTSGPHPGWCPGPILPPEEGGLHGRQTPFPVHHRIPPPSVAAIWGGGRVVHCLSHQPCC